MEPRRYKTAYIVAKICEVISWVVIMGGGIMIFTGVAFSGVYFMGGIITLGFGIMLVFSSQLTLIFIDTENNTRQAVNEIKKTNAMLAETLGKIAANLNKLVTKGDNSTQ